MAGAKLFEKLPNIKYDISLKNEPRLTKNIFVTTKVVDKYTNDPTTHYEYEVKDGETPFKIAELYYNDPNYWWVVMFFNDFRDIQTEWPKSTSEFSNYIDSVYGSQEEATKSIYEYRNDELKINTETYDLTYNWFNDNFDNPVEDAKGATPPFNDLTYAQLTSFDSYTYYEWEFDMNERNRVIKILRDDSLNDFVEEFENMIKI